MKKFKKFLTFQNFIIVILSIIVILMLFSNKETKVSEKINNPKLELPTDYTYCQRIYFYNDNDTYTISSCNGIVYVRKNNEVEKKVELENVMYIYDFYSTGVGNLVYILTKDGNVYHLSKEAILSSEYAVEKLELENIYTMKNFYVGKAKEDAYSNKIYAIDIEGNLHLIESGK